MARVPLHGQVLSPVRFPPGSGLEVPTLVVEELAAGKLTALVQRAAARDAFDAASLLELIPDLLQRPAFRVAFVCSIAASRTDARELRPAGGAISDAELESELDPLLRRRGGGIGLDCGALLGWITARCTQALDSLLSWSDGERRFLDRLLDQGEIDAAALVDEPVLQGRIARQPMLQWKAQNVREYRRGR